MSDLFGNHIVGFPTIFNLVHDFKFFSVRNKKEKEQDTYTL